MTYHYQIIEQSQSSNSSQMLASGSFTLPQNGDKNQSVTIPTADLGPRVKVEVELVNVHESIDYLLGRNGT